MTDDTTIDHWWWRPGWRVGRSFYTWHVTFNHSPAVQQLVTTFESTLSTLPTLDRVPASGLHLTVQGLGFTDEVTSADVDAIVSMATRRCSGIRPLQVTLGPPKIDREALGLPVADPAGLAAVRERLRLAIGDVWGVNNVPEVGDVFRPHLTLAYSNGTASIANIRDTLSRHGLDRLTMSETLPRISLINLNRDNKRYEWREIASIDL